MNDKLYEVLEICIRAIETGADLESVLKLYPQMEDELRPILETMQRAKSLSVPAIPEASIQRSRARVLKHAAEMRVSTPKPRRTRLMFTRFATSMALALVFLLGGTGIVGASSGALPGDNLYPVKRRWEEVRLLFAFSPEGREELESKYEQERLNEVDILLNEGREETIAFYGIVTAQNGDYWLVSGVPVQLTPKTQLPVAAVVVGAPVTVVGRTNGQGFIEAQMVGALESGVSLPPFQPTEFDDESAEGNQIEMEENEGLESHGDREHQNIFEFRGVVSAQQTALWIVNGQNVDVSQAEIIGEIMAGNFVRLEGYYGPNGIFIVTKIENRDMNGQRIYPTQNSNSDQKDGDSENSGDDVSKESEKDKDQEDDHE